MREQPALDLLQDAVPALGDEGARRLDKFYTRDDVARQCVRDFRAWSGVDIFDPARVVIEPSAGAGAFLPHLFGTTLAFDLAPEHPRIVRQDFLSFIRLEPAIVIGNPPFGKASRLAIRFFNHAAGVGTHIGFMAVSANRVGARA